MEGVARAGDLGSSSELGPGIILWRTGDRAGRGPLLIPVAPGSHRILGETGDRAALVRSSSHQPRVKTCTNCVPFVAVSNRHHISSTSLVLLWSSILRVYPVCVCTAVATSVSSALATPCVCIALATPSFAQQSRRVSALALATPCVCTSTCDALPPLSYAISQYILFDKERSIPSKLHTFAGHEIDEPNEGIDM